MNMAKDAIKLESLEQIITAPDRRQLAEAALLAFRDCVPGEHFSAILLKAKVHKIEDYCLGQSWLAAKTMFWQVAQQRLAEHPLAQRFQARPQSMTLVRSQVVLDSVWAKTWLYNELERPLGVEDLASVCQFTSADEVMILTCARSRKFSDRDLAPVHSFQRILQALIPSCVGAAPAQALTLGLSRGVHPPSPLSTLTAREGEILHWVREGKRDPEIGLILAISPRTVQHHLENVYRKLSVETRTAAAFVR